MNNSAHTKNRILEGGFDRNGNPAVFELVSQAGGHRVGLGQKVVSFRGEETEVRGGLAPQHAASEGHVYVGTWLDRRYASVYGLKWRKVK
jgi:hypothetical protein